ncbi:MAG: CDP-alcohol phosphatidyltransferase family protein [Methyloversatilis discipulorum]|nr:CDP-alcohol phosphatidyltransferase family protein [Methyloversatilis discipulorum]
MSVFSNPYAKAESIESNPLNRLLYAIAFPAAQAFVRFGITPNQITALSCIAAALAALALATGSAAWLFAIAWFTSVLLDFCDGTVARMTKQVSRTAFRFDHTSDLVKICAVLIAAASRYDVHALWVTCSVSVSVFMLYSALNHELKVARSRMQVACTAPGMPVRRSQVLRILHATFGTLNGHTLLFFLCLASGEAWALLVSIHLLGISAFGAMQRIRLLIALPKV